MSDFTEVYINAPVKNCQNCAHRRASSNGVMFDKCLRFQAYCDMAVDPLWEQCGKELREWRPIPPKPPRRSLRQWLYDTFWRKDEL